MGGFANSCRQHESPAHVPPQLKGSQTWHEVASDEWQVFKGRRSHQEEGGRTFAGDETPWVGLGRVL